MNDFLNGLKDDLDDAPINGASSHKATFLDAQAAHAKKEKPTIPCPQCYGRGQKVIGFSMPRPVECYNCKGTGRVSPDREKRVAAFKKGKETAARRTAEKRAAFVVAHPAANDWINRNAERGFGFAVAMLRALDDYGSLTDNQLAAVERCIAGDAERAAKRAAERETNAVALPEATDLLKAALDKALGRGLKRVKIVVDEFAFSPAKADSRNAGAIYVKIDGEYAGKINQGKFYALGFVSNEAKARVAEIMKDPLASATEYGKRTGRCSCCGRELTDPASIAAGIGPICADGYF